MCRNVPRCQQTFTFTPQIYGFVAESRKGGETSQHANENEGARFGGEDPAALSELREEPDDKAAKQVDCQRAVGEIDTATQTLHETAEGIARDCDQETTETYQKEFTHTN